MALITLNNDFIYNQLDYMVYMQKNLKGFEFAVGDDEESVYYFEQEGFQEEEEVIISFGLSDDKPISHEVISPLTTIIEME